MGILDDAIREHLELKRRHGADNAEVSRQEREILGGGGEQAEAPAAAAYDAPSDFEAPPVPDLHPELDADLPADAPEAPPLPVPEPLAGSPLAEARPTSPEPVGDLFPGTGELLAAASETQPAAPASRPLAAPAPADADSETAARSGARRLSDDELAAWRRRLSERADRLAAQRPGTEAPAPSAPSTTAGSAATTPQPLAKKPASEPPSYWSGNTTGADAGAPPATPPAPAPARSEPPTGAGVPVDFFDAGDAAESAFAPEAAPEPVEADHDVLDETPEFLEETPEHDRMWFEQRPPRDFDFG